MTAFDKSIVIAVFFSNGFNLANSSEVFDKTPDFSKCNFKIWAYSYTNCFMLNRAFYSQRKWYSKTTNRRVTN